ncbi:hypothetical protein PG994_003099 [Apiospora phragmitis]|uniref:DUF6546 domain-containing protein n=1 Tax=Apiospora phragmitis TaxID=2905665 RepID=A0ABR1W733_9PEZI
MINGSKQRVVGSGLKMIANAPEIPRVGKFDVFIMRRQFYRAFRAVGALNVILRAMPNLKSFMFEPWHGISQERCERQDLQHQELFEYLFAHEKLKKVVIFKNFEERMSHGYSRGSQSLPVPGEFLGRILAESSRATVTSLRLSYITDVMYFFRAFSRNLDSGRDLPDLLPLEEMRWNNPRTLVLISDELREDDDHDVLIQILAGTAKNMPRISLLEIWNSGNGHGAYIRYTRELGNTSPPKLTLGSTWGLNLSHDVLKLWNEVAEVYQCRHALKIAYDEFDAKKVKSYSTFADPKVAINSSLRDAARYAKPAVLIRKGVSEQLQIMPLGSIPIFVVIS